MALLHIKSTSIDRNVANRMVALARPVPARIEEVLTWGADEHLLLCCAAFAWTAATAYRSPLRPAAAHVLVTAIASAAASHVMKALVDQLRPDRKTLTGHLLGIPLSGDGLDAFPSGHAVHMGALASATSVLPRRYKLSIWAIALGLSGTRVAILAHWLSDVVAGFVIGIAIERGLRPLTGYPDRHLRAVAYDGRDT